MAAILAMRPGSFEQSLNLPLPGCGIWNMIEISPGVSEEKPFEKVDDADNDGSVYTISSRGAFGPGELKIFKMVINTQRNIWCGYLLKSPQHGDSNKYPHVSWKEWAKSKTLVIEQITLCWDSS